jgi:hypothetical protein
MAWIDAPYHGEYDSDLSFCIIWHTLIVGPNSGVFASSTSSYGISKAKEPRNSPGPTAKCYMESQGCQLPVVVFAKYAVISSFSNRKLPWLRAFCRISMPETRSTAIDLAFSGFLT